MNSQLRYPSELKDHEIFDNSSQTLIKRLFWLRIGVFFLLACVSAVIGSLSFFVLRSQETQNFHSVFDSSTNRISQIISVNLRTKVLTGSVLSTVYGRLVSSKFAKAPNITLPGYNDVLGSLSDLAYAHTVSFSPILTNSTRSGWEAYARKNFVDLNVPTPVLNTSTDWDVHLGIYEIDSKGKQVYSDGYTPGCNFPQLVVPVWQIFPIETHYKNIMFDMHSELSKAVVIDKVIMSKKASISDIEMPLWENDEAPSSAIFSPVVSLETGSVLGITSISWKWIDIINNILPSYVPPIYLVLSTADKTYSFLLSGGHAQLLGEGDLHDTAFNIYRKSFEDPLDSITSTINIDYSITLYPTRRFYHTYITYAPILICTLFVAIILCTTIVVLLYDHFLRNRQQGLLEETVKTKTKIANMTLHELEVKRSFVRYISHEVRNPLNIVSLGLQYVANEVKVNRSSEEILRTLREIKHTNDLAVDILNNLLTYEKLSSNMLELEKVTLPVSEFMMECLRPLSLQAKESGIKLVVRFSRDTRSPDCCMFVDKRRMSLVVRKLVSNAIKASPKDGEVVIQISSSEIRRKLSASDATRRSRSHRLFSSFSRRVPKEIAITDALDFVVVPVVKIEVMDSGIGISEANQKRLFKEIIQFNPGELQDGNGSGLGLWISHQIAEKHGGRLYMSSDGMGKGSVFVLEVPMKKMRCGVVIDHDFFSNELSLESGRLSQNACSGSSSLNSSEQRCLSQYSKKTAEFDHQLALDLVSVSNSSTDIIIPLRIISDEAGTSLPSTSDFYAGTKFGSQKTATFSDPGQNYFSGKYSVCGNETRSSKMCPPLKISSEPKEIFLCNLQKSEESGGSQSTKDSSSGRFVAFDLDKSYKHLSVGEGDSVNLVGSRNVLEGVRVLIVDDVAMNRKMLLRVLKDRWTDITEAEDGVRAVEEFTKSINEDRPFGLILMDFQMPNMNGPEAARIMRMKGYKGVIVGVTGNGLPSDIEHFQQQGANQVLIKPIRVSQLESCLEGIVKDAYVS